MRKWTADFNPGPAAYAPIGGKYFWYRYSYRCAGGYDIKTCCPILVLQFQRTDLPGEPVMKADCDLVTDTSRGTTLESNGMKINTVEHVLAALVGMGIDNVLISLNGQEVPIMDGSSEPFIELIEKAGVEEQQS